MDIDKVPQSPFASLLNFRDVGESINSLSKARSKYPKFRQGLLFRSADPNSASKEDISILRSKHKIRTILDLRSDTERKGSTGEDIGVVSNHISLLSRSYEHNLLWKMSFSGLARFFYYRAIGSTLYSTSILVSETVVPHGLLGIARGTLVSSKPELALALMHFADPDNYPILVHCAYGKDRTGVLVALILIICGVDEDFIAVDYMASERELAPSRDQIAAKMGLIGMGEEFVGCSPGLVRGIRSIIEEESGEVDVYFECIGVDSEVRQNIRKILIEE